MGFWGDKKDEAKDAAKEKLTGAVTWPVRVIKDKIVEKYLKSKGKWVTGECPQCGKPISGGNRKQGIVHKKCWSDLNKAASKWESSMNINNTLYYPNCSHNKNAYSEDHHNQICNKGN